MISFTINGMQVTAEKDETILQVAQRNGISIPTLCHHPAVETRGACRLCLVEITQGKWNWVATSCNLPPKEGFEVKTHSEKILKHRRMILELLMARCPESEDLRILAAELGVAGNRFRAYRDKSKTDNCILCGLCVRVCESVMGRSAIGFAGRGWKRTLTTPFNADSAVCMACGACAKVCPTHAVRERLFSTEAPRKNLSAFNAGLSTRPAIGIPFPQAVPNVPTLDPEKCVHMLTGECGLCAEVCQAKAIDYTQTDKTETIDVGAVILAPGVEPFDPTDLKEFGYGIFPNVLSSIQYERILCASGPTEGHIVRPSDHSHPHRIAFLQCVGSRDTRCKREYCSSVCCTYATKEAILTQEHCPGTEATIFGMDFRTHGKDFEKFMNRAQSEYGIQYIHSRVPSVDEDPATGNLWVTYEDEAGKTAAREFDLVVLSVGLDVPAKVQALAGKIGVAVDEYGFARAPENRPLTTSRPGVYVCGAFEAPKDIPESVMQASGAAALAAATLRDSRNSLVTKKEYVDEIDVAGQHPRVGVFVCSCGSNIGGVVDVARVTNAARDFTDVALSESFLYTCSQDALNKMKDRIKEHNLNRVVVASCTPRTHEPLFQETIREAGLNRYLFEMANIRDQCSWVHGDAPERATDKAIDLVRSAVAKVRGAESLHTKFFDICKSGLVIGGGVAGMTAALSLADQGFQAYLVEKESELGGLARRIHSTLEGMNVSDYLASLRKRIAADPRIQVFTSSRVADVYGSIGSFKTKLQTAAGEKEIEHGVIIVATGGRELRTTEYGNGSRKGVMTQMEFEERVAAGKNLDALKTVAMIQCVGSRDKEYPNCSRVCCVEAVKNAIAFKKKRPDAKVTVLYRDLRTYGVMEKHYRIAREMGVSFVRYQPDSKPVVGGSNGTLAVRYHDPVLQRDVDLAADAVVLSVGARPSETNPEMAPMLKVPLTDDGYFFEAHVKLRPVDFATDGIFVCGMAHSPKLIKEAAAQGLAAASRAATILSKDKMETMSIISSVDPELCSGCHLCQSACPYTAVSFDKDRGVSLINATLCKGCGTCVANCPSGAAQQLGFRDDQIFDQIAAVTFSV